MTKIGPGPEKQYDNITSYSDVGQYGCSIAPYYYIANILRIGKSVNVTQPSTFQYFSKRGRKQNGTLMKCFKNPCVRFYSKVCLIKDLPKANTIDKIVIS